MNQSQLARMHEGQGFIAALDQSGGSTPKALAQYGIKEDQYNGEKEMYDMVHRMRTRIVTSPAFNAESILGVILFENTMDKEIDGIPSADYLWQRKGIVPFLKIDQGLADRAHGVQLMKDIAGLDALLKKAAAKSIFGTKMRSVIHEGDGEGIKLVVEQQFAFAEKIMAAGLVPIIEPEASINAPDRAESEQLLLRELKANLSYLGEKARLMFKLSIPVVDNFYAPLMKDPRVVRVVALSGGYSRREADEKLAKNHGLIASFSRALAEGLSAKQTDAQFNAVLGESIREIYQASVG